MIRVALFVTANFNPWFASSALRLPDYSNPVTAFSYFLSPNTRSCSSRSQKNMSFDAFLDRVEDNAFHFDTRLFETVTSNVYL